MQRIGGTRHGWKSPAVIPPRRDLEANYDHDGSARPFFSKPKNNELYVMLLEKDGD